MESVENVLMRDVKPVLERLKACENEDARQESATTVVTATI
jgi:hypothetical protein